MTSILKIPTGHPYVLFKISSGANDKFVAAATDEQALRITRSETDAVAEPVKISSLIGANGHSGANKILSKIAPRWICREDYIFFRQKSDWV